MGVRAKTTVLLTLEKHFLEFELPLDIDQKSYMNIVGRTALSTIAIKRSFKAWKYAMVALRSRMRVVNPTIKSSASVKQSPVPPSLLDIRDRWRNSTAAPSKDPYSGVNLATIVNKHGKDLANGTDLEKQYMRGALIEIWLSNKARGMDSSKVPVTQDLRWKNAEFGDLTKEEEEHLATGLTASESGLGFGHEQPKFEKKEKLSGLEALKQLGAKKEEDNGKDI